MAPMNNAPVKLVVRGDPREVPVTEDALKAFNAESRAAMSEASDDLLRAVRSQLRRSHYPPSAQPGAPPALRGGELMGSFKKMRITVSKYKVRGGVESRHPGAGRQEYGGVDKQGIRTFPHPYLGPAAREAQASIENILSRMLADV